MVEHPAGARARRFDEADILDEVGPGQTLGPKEVEAHGGDSRPSAREDATREALGAGACKTGAPLDSLGGSLLSAGNQKRGTHIRCSRRKKPNGRSGNETSIAGRSHPRRAWPGGHTWFRPRPALRNHARHGDWVRRVPVGRKSAT